MSKWGKCGSEGREHQLSDFRSYAIHHDGKIIGHQEKCRWCSKTVGQLIEENR